MFDRLREGYYELKTSVSVGEYIYCDRLIVNVNALETDPEKVMISSFSDIPCNPGRIKYTHFAVSHNVDKYIVELRRAGETKSVDPSHYSLYLDGRLLEIDAAEFKDAQSGDSISYDAIYNDGSIEPLTLWID